MSGLYGIIMPVNKSKPTQEDKIIAPVNLFSEGITTNDSADLDVDRVDSLKEQLLDRSVVEVIISRLDLCEKSKDDRSLINDCHLYSFSMNIVQCFDPIIRDHYAKWAKSISISPNSRHAGRKPFDPVFIFKILLLGSFKAETDLQIIKSIKDSTSLKLLLNVKSRKEIPCSSTLHNYHAIFDYNDFFFTIFNRVYHLCLNLCKVTYRDLPAINDVGKYVSIDATFKDCTWRRDPVVTNNAIKKVGMGREVYPSKNEAKQKDVKARFGYKDRTKHFGYKEHIVMDIIFHLVSNVEVTPANVHDVKMFLPLIYSLDSQPEVVTGDSGYTSQECVDELSKDGICALICRRGTRGHPLTREQIQNNSKTTPLRRVVEFAFAWHNDRPRCKKRNMELVRIDCILYYTTYNIKRTFSLLTKVCNVKSIQELKAEAKRR